jgi:hypothetical protein
LVEAKPTRIVTRIGSDKFGERLLLLLRFVDRMLWNMPGN